MAFDDDIREPEEAMVPTTCEVCGAPPLIAGESRCWAHPIPTAWSWRPAQLWPCPRGCGTFLLRELRCPKCGGTDGV